MNENTYQEVTKEMLLAAATYMPLADKEEWVAKTAPGCFDKLAITADGEAMPPMYMVNMGLKSRYLMAVLVNGYLGQEIETEEKDEALMSEAEYDRWAGSHVINQIERWKKDPEVRDICYDLLCDYRDLEKRLSAHLGSLLAVQNDPVIRQSEYSAAQMKALPQLMEQFKAMQEGKENGQSA